MTLTDENVLASIIGNILDLLQGVVTYMSSVEAFATGIKTGSSDQSTF